MAVNGVDSSSNNTTGSTARTKKDILDKDVFLKILTVQLANQDPLNPKDNSEYIAQLAQFTSLEQSKNLNTTMDKMLLSQKITEGNQMVGQNVQFIVDDKSLVELVKGVTIDSGSVYLITDSGEINIDNAVAVAPSDKSLLITMNNVLLSQNFNTANQMIGKNIDFLVDKKNSTELVKGVKISNNAVYLITDKGQRSFDDIVGAGVTQSDQ